MLPFSEVDVRRCSVKSVFLKILQNSQKTKANKPAGLQDEILFLTQFLKTPTL